MPWGTGNMSQPAMGRIVFWAGVAGAISFLVYGLSKKKKVPAIVGGIGLVGNGVQIWQSLKGA